MRTRLRRHRAVVGVVALVVGLTACSSPEDELRRARLDDALAATFDGPLAFTLELDATDEALAAFGDEAGRLGGLLARSRAAGVLEDDRVALALTVAGVDLVQARLVGDDEVYVRSDLAAIAQAVGGAEGGTLATTLAQALADAGIGTGAVDAVLAAVDGDWVRLEQPATAGDAATPDVDTSVPDALRALLGAGEVTSHVGRLEGDDPFDGQLTRAVDPDVAAAAFLGALAGLDPTASLTDDVATPAVGTEPVRVVVVVTGGRITTIDAGLASVLRVVSGAERTEGTTDVGLVLRLRGLDPEEPLVVAPAATTSVTVAELTEALDVLGGLVPGLAP